MTEKNPSTTEGAADATFCATDVLRNSFRDFFTIDFHYVAVNSNQRHLKISQCGGVSKDSTFWFLRNFRQLPSSLMFFGTLILCHELLLIGTSVVICGLLGVQAIRRRPLLVI